MSVRLAPVSRSRRWRALLRKLSLIARDQIESERSWRRYRRSVRKSASEVVPPPPPTPAVKKATQSTDPPPAGAGTVKVIVKPVADFPVTMHSVAHDAPGCGTK